MPWANWLIGKLLVLLFITHGRKQCCQIVIDMRFNQSPFQKCPKITKS